MQWLKDRFSEGSSYAGLAVLCVVLAFAADTLGASGLVLPLVVAAAAAGAGAVGIPEKFRDRF